ncbi:hypothetical protein FP435_01925 [Lactobacillus sp. PV037]|uniref:hypothetical protein n=1 Tax=unclassified Lactobacillus TaxID=2620435 RepID=UPI00223F073D|nr:MULTISPECIES: hypothetical protein [unclassified Lactobacillus]QNQ82606.1 hypothetical protein FP433_05890 [Lactobacillus sp. PV012]QNQ83279.1 hypothetical protein FP435_01925 [Lactobacillus sp. PV037]
MQLSSFLQLTNDLNKNYSLFYRPDKKRKFYPLNKVTITSTGAYFSTGNSSKTLASFKQIVATLHHKKLPLLIKYQNKIIKIYGIQIDMEHQRIYLF